MIFVGYHFSLNTNEYRSFHYFIDEKVGGGELRLIGLLRKGYLSTVNMHVTKY